MKRTSLLALAVVSVATIGATVYATNPLNEGGALDRDTAAKDTLVQASLADPRSSFQDNLLRDGTLSAEEYDAAFAEYSVCVTQAGAGFFPDPPVKNSRGTWMFVVRGDATGDRNAVQACGREYWDAIQSRWTAEHLPLHSEVEATKAGIVQCMRDRGIAMPENLPEGWGTAYSGKPAPAGLRTDREAGQAFADCSRAAGEQLGYGPGGGLVP